MTPLPNMPSDNRDFNVLLERFESLGLFDDHIKNHEFEIPPDYAKPGPHPKHCLKTNFVVGHGLVVYREEEEPLWPNKNRIMLDTFIPPILPEGELPVTPELLPEDNHTRLNLCLTATGPKLTMGKQEQTLIAMVSLLLGHVLPEHPPSRPWQRIEPMQFLMGIGPNPFRSQQPYTITFSEAEALNYLYDAVKDKTPTFPEFETATVDALLKKYSGAVGFLLNAITEGNKARPFLGGRGNRGWYHIFNLRLSPIMTALNKCVRESCTGGDAFTYSSNTKQTLSDLIQGMTVAILAADPRFEAAESNQADY